MAPVGRLCAWDSTPMRTDLKSLNRHYASFYEGDDKSAWRELGARDKARSVEQLVEPPVSRIADIGCGDGSVIAALRLPVFAATQFTGYDVSPSAIEAARRRRYRSPVGFEVFDGERIPCDDNAFDVAILSHVLEHVADPRGLLLEGVRVAPRVLIEVPLELHLRTPRFRWDDTGHINVFNRRSIRHFVESCGLVLWRERIYCPSRKVHAFRGGRSGEVHWALKAAALHVGGSAIFTYHYAVLAVPGT
jgi:SAM-dependent methyltransferase